VSGRCRPASSSFTPCFETAANLRAPEQELQNGYPQSACGRSVSRTLSRHDNRGGLAYDRIIRQLLPILWLTAVACAQGQSVEIYSLFHRLDPFGHPVIPDQGISTREILSPAAPRNGFLTFHIAVTLPIGENYLLYVVTNPLDACRVAMYKEHFVKTDAGWIPDSLTELDRLPDFGVAPDPDDQIEGQTTRLYLLDLWIPPDANVGRFRLEVQLKVGTWTVRPLEVRIMPARVPHLPSGDAAPQTLPQMPADATVYEALQEYFAGHPPLPPPGLRTVRDFIRRNIAQDLALVASADRPMFMQQVLSLFDVNNRFTPRLLGPEWYLRIQDRLYQR
jgi:hypothetical protein